MVAGDIAPIEWQEDEARVALFTLDVRSATDWHRAVDAALARFGKLDILVNCAGLNPAGAAGHDAALVGLEHWRHTQAVNVEGTVLGCQHALPALRRSPNAAIVNLSALAATLGVPGDPAYAASKAAVASYTKSLALYCAGSSVRCNALLPGDIRTPTYRALTAAQAAAAPASHVPMRRLGEADEVAWAALFLASDDASYITGAELCVDGGLSAT